MSVIGTVELIASIDTTKYKKGAQDIEDANERIEGSTDSADKKTDKGSKSMTASLVSLSKFGFAAMATVAVAAFAMVTSHIDDAVRRIDTLNNAPKVLQNLGYSADDSAKSINTLKDGIKGLPTRLDAAVNSLTAIAAASGYSAAKSTELTLAFNNMALAGGKGSQEAERALTQFVQALGRGKFEMEDFNTLAEVMPAQITQLAKSLLGPTANVATLKTALSEGNVTMNQFVDGILKLNTTGGDGFASFSKQAIDSTRGMQTSWENFNAAIIRGTAKIIETIGSNNIANAISSSGAAFENALVSLAGGFQVLVDAVSETIKWLQPVFDYLNENKQVAELLTTGLQVLGGLIVGLVVVALVALAGAAAIVSTLFQGMIDLVSWGIEMFLWLNGIVFNVAAGMANSFLNAYRSITTVFAPLIGFFANLWAGIVSIFTNIGVTVGNAISGAVKSAINSVIRGAVGIVNGFIGTLNGVIDIINNLPGVKLGKIGNLPVPQLAEGGIVSSPTLAMIGEGRESEAVIPLSKLDAMINGDNKKTSEINIGTINLANDVDVDRFFKRLTRDTDITGFGMTPRTGF